MNNTQSPFELLPNCIELEIGNDGYLPHVGDWERDGASIGRNTKLREVALNFSSGGEVAKEDLENFFHGLAANRSIKILTFTDCTLFNGEIFSILIPFFNHNQSFGSLVIEGCEMRPGFPRKLASALGEFDSLKEFTLDPTPHKHYDSNAARMLIESLAGHFSLRKLDMHGVKIGRNGFTALSSLLQNPRSNLSVLNIGFSGIDDEAAVVLATGLTENRMLEELNLNGNRNISQQGWQAIFGVLQIPSCRLEGLSLDSNTINDAAVIYLSNALVGNSTLKTLSLRSNSITTWRAMFQFLRSPDSALEEFNLGRNRFNDDIMNSLANSLANNSKLRKLNLSGNRDVTSAGWQAFSAVLLNPDSALESIGLSDNAINDDAFNHLTNSIASNNKLKELGLGYNHSVSAAGWEGLSTILRNPNSALEKLYLQGNSINDRTLTTLANSLANNSKLIELLFVNVRNITADGWNAFSRVLNNTSDIIATYHSNHTLEKLCDDDAEHRLPEDVRSNLRLNRENGNSQAARLKIIETHFSGSDIGMQPFIDMELNALPYAVAWMGTYGIGEEGTWGEGFDLLYQFSCVMLPTLLD
jgi:Ran GTPase-activating protein (RanGAP) involved in mRNA processing and transport